MEQTKAKSRTQAATYQLLDYLATHLDATIRYHVPYMILHIQSDASYLSLSNVRSRLCIIFFCGDKLANEDTLNSAILNIDTIIKNMVASAAESKVGAYFQNAQSGAPIRVILIELGHTQPATPVRTDNSEARVC
jgi:hypothetical protein